MNGFLRNLFRKTGKSTEPLQEQEKKERPPNDDGYLGYCIELEQALRDLETYLLTCDDPKEIAMQALKTACTFYGGDWAGTLEIDLDFDVWAPVWWYNPGIQDRTNQLILEFESSDSMSRWINAMRLGKNIVIPDVNAIKEENPEEYAVYERLFVQSLIAVPFIPSPTGFLVIRNPSRYIDRSSMLSALAHVLHRAMAQQKAIESAKLAPTPDLVQSSKDVAINFFGDMEICTKKGVLSERFFNSPKSSRVITYIILNPKTAHPPLEIYHALWPNECVEPEVAGRNIRGYLHILHQQIGKKCRFLRRFLCKQLLPFFSQFGNPAFEVLNELPNGLHQAVDGFDFPVQVADIRLDTTFFHLPDSSPLMDSRDNIKPLSGIRTQVHTLRAVIGFQIAVLDDLPFMPPDFTILLVVPVHRILLVTFPSAGRKFYSFPIFVKVINLTALGKPFPMFVHCSHSQQDMGVGIVSRRMGVMDGKVSNHAF